MGRRSAIVAVVIAVVWFAMPAPSFAQSAIAGVVKDATGGVLPGVSVEASSPALIEKTRTVVSNGAGQYRIIDLRPGTYTITFTLSGFSVVKREGLELPPNFTATVNAEVVVGAVEETITVSGASPVIDVHSAAHTEVLPAALLAALPTARNFQTAGLALPGLKAGGFDVGGSTQQQQGVLVAYGGHGLDQIMLVDGMNTMSSSTGGGGVAVYHNVGGYQELVYQTFGSSAEMQSAGVIMNMIPKTGGNRVTFEGVGLFAKTAMEGNNLTSDLLAKGFRVAGKLAKVYDVNGSLGFPVMKDRLWWFTSGRLWTYDRYVSNQFYPNGDQAIDDNITQALTNRMTWQISPKHKFTALYDKLPRSRYHSGIENGNISPEASTITVYALGYIAQAKYTGTLSNKLLVDAGYSQGYYRANGSYQSASQLPSATDPYGAISHLDSITGQTTVAPASLSRPLHQTKFNLSSSVTYVTGSHAVKSGVQYSHGLYRQWIDQNGNIQQLYRNGVPYAVNVFNTPIFARTNLDADWGVYVQDSWTLHHLTLTPGLRFESLHEGIPVQTAPAGRFVPARHFDAVSCRPCWNDIMARLGAAYDLFGDGKTAIKGSVGKYMNTDLFTFGMSYNPMVSSTDQRTWTDLNRDDIAQDNELGPSTNVGFGVRVNRNPAPGIQRPYQMLYSVGVQRELTSGVSASAGYYRRRYHRIISTENLAVPVGSGYTPVTIPDPRGNGQTLTVYNLKPGYLGLVNLLDNNSTVNSRTYNGFDITFNARLPGQITVVGGMSSGKFDSVTCDAQDPNNLRYCDARQPFTTGLKLSGTVPLKYGFRFSGVLQSMPGLTFDRNAGTDSDIIQTYVITRAVIPTLTLPSVILRLNEPGTDFMPRVNQLDLSVSRRFRVGRMEVLPQLEVFNALNVSPELSITRTFGSAYGFPLTVLPARLFRAGMQVSF